MIADTATAQSGAAAVDPDHGGRPPKPRPLQPMFHAVPATYDLLNRVLTWGFDQRWRRRAALSMIAGAPRRVLDLGSGTADLALLLADPEGGRQVVAADFSVPMLHVARRKAELVRLRKRPGWICADAAWLPFASESFDAVGIAFAFRNLTYRNPLTRPALAEIRRILRPSGRLTVVETSQPRSPFLRAGYHAYLRLLVGPLGGLVSGQPGAYRYLATSARLYYSAQEVSNLLRDAGFTVIQEEPLLFGVAAIHVAARPEVSLAHA